MSHTEKHEIDSHKTYQIPKDISVIQYNGKILIIAPDTANWIVLNTLEQLNVFNSFKEGHSIKFCLADKSFNSDDVTYVVTQIEARKLCTKKIHKAIDDERGIHLYLTNSCNLCCPHCYMFSGKANKDELTTEEIKCIIDDYVWIFPYVVTTNDKYPPMDKLEGCKIGKFSLITTGSILLPGVKVGENAMVAAGAVVSKDVPDGRVFKGVPAKDICAIEDIKDNGKDVYPWKEYLEEYRGYPWQEAQKKLNRTK